jgi:glycosyltransferase involved in cell wall biosynthesis
LPDVTIYIASINTAPATELCIRSISRYTERNSYLLSVGDCGSTDSSLPRLMKMLHDNLIDDVALAPNGRPHGAWLDLWTSTCATRFALMIDSDVEIRKANWMNVLLHTAEDTEAAIVCAEFVDEVPNCLDRNGLPIRLARRPSAWMMLVDVEKCRDRASWQFAIEEDTSIPERQWALDTGAQLMRTLNLAGEEVVAAPTSFLDSFRHFGGLSWVKSTPSENWRHRAHLLKVRLLNVYVFSQLVRLKVRNARHR